MITKIIKSKQKEQQVQHLKIFDITIRNKIFHLLHIRLSYHIKRCYSSWLILVLIFYANFVYLIILHTFIFKFIVSWTSIWTHHVEYIKVTGNKTSCTEDMNSEVSKQLFYFQNYSTSSVSKILSGLSVSHRSKRE